jgi:nicotinic acid mononucleotide adenylyltransferase
MEFRRRVERRGRAAVVFPGAFNPPTRAHLALARAAGVWAPEVIFVVPRVFPHKGWEGPGLEDRLELLLEATGGEPGFTVAVSATGLFIEIARALRGAYPGLERLLVLCGRDAAERAAGWNYGEPDALERQLAEYELLVAPRAGVYLPPEPLRGRVHTLEGSGGCDDISSTEVRARIAAGTGWEELVPPRIESRVRRIYSSGP